MLDGEKGSELHVGQNLYGEGSASAIPIPRGIRARLLDSPTADNSTREIALGRSGSKTPPGDPFARAPWIDDVEPPLASHGCAQRATFHDSEQFRAPMMRRGLAPTSIHLLTRLLAARVEAVRGTSL